MNKTANEIYEKYHLPINCKMVNSKRYKDSMIMDVWFEFDKYRYHRSMHIIDYSILKSSKNKK